ncbi:hypothetical protein [Caballeronia cordobensis]|uniref:hypothetical protein n=1 Tax=Caballeronia cordobensis TaxID=1353886 RepID=UPI00045EE98C|nr:hypothetical protein BRPE67_BCDS12220 [Burkholderia sp. RPE67]
MKSISRAELDQAQISGGQTKSSSSSSTASNTVNINITSKNSKSGEDGGLSVIVH